MKYVNDLLIEWMKCHDPDLSINLQRRFREKLEAEVIVKGVVERRWTRENVELTIEAIPNLREALNALIAFEADKKRDRRSHRPNAYEGVCRSCGRFTSINGSCGCN